MSKHTVFVEAPPFAKFSDAEMRRLLDDERLEVLDWRGKRVNAPGFVEALATADIAVTGNSLTITDELLEKLPNLKLIAKLGTGLDMIDIPSVLRRGILLCNTPGANSVAVAEHTFALLLGYLRNVPQCDNAVRTGQWEKARTMGGEICGKTVGIIGLGNIGSRVASRMAGFEARLLGTDPCWPEALAAKYGIERRELNELLAESDIVCVHCPLDETTAGFIGKAELALMKPSALLVNMARGGIVDEDALYEALRGKVISGAIIDAYSQEPLTASPLFSLDNVILSPHAGAFTTDALNAMSRMSVDQLFQYVDGAMPDNLVTAE